LAIVCGNNLVRNEQWAKQIFIYKKDASNSKFEFYKRIIIKDRDEF
jgi:hypothetical protein